MRSRLVCALLSLFAAAMISGCGMTTPAASAPVLGIHSVGEAASIGDTTYTVTSDFSPMPGRGDLELLTVHVEWTSSAQHKTGGVNVESFGSDGAPRVEPANAESLGARSNQWESSESGSSGTATALFSVRKGETGLVIAVDDGSSPDLRWQAR